MTIIINVTACEGGGCGLQSAILDACPWDNSNVVSCNPGTGVGGSMILESTTMEVDSFYWLVIDGCAGQLCDYLIDFVEGIFSPGINGELTDAFTDDEVVCQGQDEWTATAEPELPEAAGYLWTGFPWGDGTHTSTFYDMSGPDDALSIPDNAPVGGPYEICVVAFSGCDTTENPQCFDIWIEAVDDGISPDVILCPEEYDAGVVWEGLSIPGPGTYTIEFNTPEGCPYDSIKTYDEFPAPDQGVIDTVVCELSFIYETVEYNSAGSYDLFYDDGSIYGCDSTAELNLDLIYLEVETDFFCEYTQFTLTSQVILAIPGSSGITYEWYHDNLLVSEDPSFTTFEPGSYELFVSYEINGVECMFAAITNPLVINLDDLVPPAPVFSQISNSACALDFPIYCVEEEPDILEWVWTGPNGVSIFGNGEPCVEVSWQGSSGGLMCVHAVNHCGAGPDTCFNVDVIPSPLADFTMPVETCVDSAVTILFSGQSSDDATFLWNFGGGAMIISGGTGEGPHEVSWSSPGFRTVTLQIIEAGCDTADISYDIYVELLGQPVINCTSTLNSITFTWSEVVGASGYQVNPLQGPIGVLQDDTSYLVTGLLPGTVVEIEVVVMGVGACAERSATLQCIAQSCPAKDLAIILPSDSLCLGDVSAPISLTATVDGVISTGTWSGPGVDPAGTFDPHAPGVGAGQHQIIFTYDEGTCSYNEQTVVYVFDTPTADFTLDGAICQDGDASVIYAGNASLAANFAWDFGPGAMVVAGTGAGPYALHWNNPGTYTISLTVAENNCNSQVFMQTVDVQPTLTAPSIQCFPTTNSVTLEWTNVPNAISYDVTQLFGPAGNVNGNQFVVTGLTPGDSVSINLTVSGGGLCPPVTVQASCVAKNCPTPTFAITPVDDICLYAGTGTVDLDITVTNGGGTGFWSGPGIVDATQGIFNPVLSGAGSHTLQYNYLDEGCSFVENVIVDVYDPPVADISNTTFVLTCDNNNQLDLDGSNSSAPGAISYSWTTTNGVILTPADQAVITAGAPGTYQLLITDIISGCEDAVSVTLVRDDNAPTSDAGPDGLLNCNISFVVLGGMSSQGPSIEYLWTTEGGVIGTDPTLPTITVTVGGTYELAVTDVANGCTSIDEAIVNENFIFPSGVLSVSDTLDCDTETTTVSASITPAGNTYDYLWTTTDGMIQPGASTDEIVASRPGTYTVIVTSQINGCRDTVSIEVFGDDDIISGIQTIVDDPDCVGDLNGQIDVQAVTGGNPPFSYTWSHQATGPLQINLGPGTYTVTVTDANGCRLTETFTLPAPVAINPDIGPNLQYNITEVVVITLSLTNSGTVADVIWEGVAPPCSGCLQIEFPAEMTGQVLVTVIDTNGCTASASLMLTVLRPRHIFIPSVFSPNGDDLNDLFTVSGNTLTEVKALRVFDRWGGLVYEQLHIPANSAVGWDGTYSGKQMNPGVYVYMAELIHDDGLEEIIKGDVTLIR
ncbi:MAG TPA: gliding motility-associated C-terminal domain-containing protein [Saprospiraceae bacterium]|nr:gliding motility-associated C-terminal domain-containing protein [Saprospiraceae bacterium]